MADKIQIRLEQMLPELEDLMIAGIFSKDEVKTIVKKRRHFEYLIERAAKEKNDYLMYLEYEMALELCKKKRIERLKMKNVGLAKYGGLTRIQNLFRRALIRYPGDIRLWFQFIDFLMICQRNITLATVFAEAISLHPQVTGLWILAAEWEFSKNNNMFHARKLLQRAIRVNKTAPELYHEYCRLELVNLENTPDAKFQVEKTETQQEEGTINVEALPDSKEPVELIDLRGTTVTQIVQAVYKAGCNQISGFPFRAKFISILRNFRGTKEIIKFIYSDLEEAFGDQTQTQVFLCLKPVDKYQCNRRLEAEKSKNKTQLSVHENVQGEDYSFMEDEGYYNAAIKSLRIWETKLDEIHNNELFLALLDWISFHLDIMNQSQGAHFQLRTVFEDILNGLRTNFFSGKLRSELQHNVPFILSLSLSLIKAKDVRSALDVIKQGFEFVPDNSNLSAQLLALTRAFGTNEEVETIFQETIQKFPQNLSLYQEYLNYLISHESPNFPEILTFYREALRQLTKSTSMSQFQAVILTAAQKLTPEQQTELYSLTLNFPPISLQIWLLSIDVEIQKQPQNPQRIRDLFHRAISTYGAQDDSLWLKFIRWEHSNGNFQEGSQIYFQAVRALKAPESFIVKYNQTNNS